MKKKQINESEIQERLKPYPAGSESDFSLPPV